MGVSQEKIESSVAYHHSDLVHNTRAAELILPYLLEIISPKSVVDVGCGLGTWLAVCEKLGVSDVLGLDGSNVDTTRLAISPRNFKAIDLRKPFSLERKFDMLLCLEVAEHLPEAGAEGFVRSLTRHADVIIFSAAIPGQGGQNHINEQWLSHWVARFAKEGFALHDVVRQRFWENKNIDIWYRQNIVLFAKKDSTRYNSFDQHQATCIDIVHPELFAFYAREAARARMLENGQAGLSIAIRSLWNAIWNRRK